MPKNTLELLVIIIIPGFFFSDWVLVFVWLVFFLQGGGNSLLPQPSSGKQLNSSKIAKIFQKCCTHYRHLGKLQYTNLAKIQQWEKIHRRKVIGQLLILGFAVCAEHSDPECMLVWGKSCWTRNPKQIYPKSGICLSLQGLEECMLFIEQAMTLNIWFINVSPQSGCAHLLFVKWGLCGFLIIWAFLSHEQYVAHVACLHGKTEGKKKPQAAKEFTWKTLETKHAFTCLSFFKYNWKRKSKE